MAGSTVRSPSVRTPRTAVVKKPAAPELTAAELETTLLNALAKRPGDLKKALGTRTLDPRALALAEELARAGRLVRVLKGKTTLFFLEEPAVTLDNLVPTLLGSEGLAGDALKRRVAEAAPSHAPLVADWLKGALSRNVLFVRKMGKKSLYAREPDVAGALVKAIAEVKKAATALAKLGVPTARVVEAIGSALGVATPSAVRAPASASVVLLTALRDYAATRPSGALLEVAELRARTRLDKVTFDRAALALAREGVVVLHHHDYAASLSDQEREGLVSDERGTYYVGIALRRSAS